MRRGIAVGEQGDGIRYTHDPRVALDGLHGPGYTEPQVHELLARVPRSLCVMAEGGIGESGDGVPGGGEPESSAMEDSSMVKRFLRDRRHAFAELDVAWVPGGHHAHLDTPAPVAAAIVSFLRRTPPPAKM